MADDVPALPSKKRSGVTTISKPSLQPVHAWTIVANDDDYYKKGEGVATVDLKQKKYEDDVVQMSKQGFINDVAFDASKQGPQIPWTKRLFFFYVSFLLYGIDISNTITGYKKWLLFALKYLILVLILFLCVFHWMEIVCALKDNYLEYGSSLVNLVFAARMTATIVSHTILHNRRKTVAKLMADMDEIGDTVPYSWIDKRNIVINLFWGLFSIFMYCAFPVKYYYDHTVVDPIIHGNTTPSAFFEYHELALSVLDNVFVNILTFFILYFDSVALTFFVAFAARFFGVFRAAPFCRWLGNGEKHEIGIVMKKFRTHHYIICNFVEQVDVVFAPTVLIWYVYLTMSLCCWIRGISSSAFETFNGAAMVVFSLIEALVEFYFLSVSTSLINDEVTAHLDSIRLMCINEDLQYTTSVTHIQVKWMLLSVCSSLLVVCCTLVALLWLMVWNCFELVVHLMDRINHLSYITCVLASPVSLTGWGFFSVSRGFVLTVSSTVLTFTLVLYGV